MNDPILDELHATRERLLAESGGTLADLVTQLRREENASGRILWTPRRTNDSPEADEEPQLDSKSTPSAR